ncbi:MAG: hypothetical protein NTY51_10305 [Deltaproteobacteria bacterium]|nr:hypothetical protein [Deltaproteobacteria bacterium]
MAHMGGLGLIFDDEGPVYSPDVKGTIFISSNCPEWLETAKAAGFNADKDFIID